LKLLSENLFSNFFNIDLVNIKNKKKRNPMAKDLRSPKYKQRTVKNKKIYNRKKKNIT
tara:strand:+ start:687 stop:860 length:174 start_codon:yes stop_codon:yes gene_type:complete